MFLEQLVVQHFGHFADVCQLSLPPNTRFAVLYGANGTGKTTLLNAFRSVLFGVEESTLYAPSDAAVPPFLSAVLRDQHGAELSIVRHKRRTGSLTGTKQIGGMFPQTVPLDETTFPACLGMQDRKLYQAVFGFTLRDLEDGEKVLREATVSELLAGGELAGGANQIRALLQLFKATQAGLWTKSGRNPSINKNRARLNDLSAEMRRSNLSETKYGQLRSNLRTCQTQAESLEQALAQLERDERKRFRQIKAYPAWEELRQTEQHLLLLPDGGDRPLKKMEATKIRELFQRLENARKERDDAEAEWQSLQTEDSAYQSDPTLFQHEAVINRLLTRIDTIATHRSEIPMLLTDQERARRDMDQKLYALLPEANWEQLYDETSLGLLLDQLRPLWQMQQQIDGEKQKARGRYDEYETELKQIERTLESSFSGTTAFPESLRPHVPLLNDRKQACWQWQKNEEELLRKQTDMRHRFEVLRPPLPAETTLRAFPLPVVEVINVYAEQHRALLDAYRVQREHLAALENEAAQYEAELNAFVASQSVLQESMVQQERARRDALLEAWLSVGLSPEGRTAYTQAVLSADTLADNRFHQAAEVGRLREMQMALAKQQAQVQHQNECIQNAQADIDEWEGRWKTLWADLGISTSLQPSGKTDVAAVKAMQNWRDEVGRLQENAAEIGKLEAQQAALSKVVVPFEAALDTAFPDMAAAPLTERITCLEELVRLDSEATGARRAKQERIAFLEQEVRGKAEALSNLQQMVDALDSERLEYLTKLNLSSELSLAQAVRLLEGLHELRQRRAQWEQKEHDRQMRVGLVDAFDKEVMALRVLLEPVAFPDAIPEAHSCEDWVQMLHQRLADAKEEKAEQKARAENRERSLQRRDERRNAVSSLEDECDIFLSRHNIASENELWEAASQAELRVSLTEQQSRSRATVAAILELSASSQNDSGLEAEIASLMCDQSLPALEQERERLQNQVEAKRKELADALQAIGRHQNELDNCGTADAAFHAAQCQEVRAILQHDVDEHVINFLAERVLQRVVDGFARTNQPELLQVASRLIAQITEGRYAQVRQWVDDKKPEDKRLVLVESQSGASRTPDRLSTGEREQLFLALRLAYVTRYCRAAEPLPIVLDDVLVNFDDRRQLSTLQALAEVSQTTQVLFLTCHRDLRDLAQKSVPGAFVWDIPNKG